MNYNIIHFIKEDFKQNALKGQLLTLEEMKERAVDYHAEEEELAYIHKFYDFIINLNFLNELSHFEEISFLGDKGYIVKKGSEKSFYKFPYSNKDFELMLQIICIKEKIDWNYNTPFKSFKLQTKRHTLRATFLHSSLGCDQSCRLFLRKIEEDTFALESFTDNPLLLKEFIKTKKNIILCGATGSGKTSLMSSLLQFIPAAEHVITIEDTEELIYKNLFHTALLATENKEMNELLSYSLRMTPERIILGEMRSKEITTFLLAMNTGHKGLISTLHANNASDAIDRMALMFTLYQKGDSLDHNEIVRLIAKSVDIIIFVENKRVKEIVEIMGSENGIPYFRDLKSPQIKEALFE